MAAATYKGHHLYRYYDLIATISPYWLRTGPQNFTEKKNALPLRNEKKITTIFLQQILFNNMGNSSFFVIIP